MSGYFRGDGEAALAAVSTFGSMVPAKSARRSA